MSASKAPMPSSQTLAGDEKYAAVGERSASTTDHTNEDTQSAATTPTSTGRSLGRRASTMIASRPGHTR